MRSFNCYKLKAYAVISIRNTCIDYLNEKKKEAEAVDYYNSENMENISDSNSPDSIVFGKFEWEIISKAMLKLNDREQDYIIKYYIDDLDDKTIAKLTGMKLNNLRTYRYRLLIKLRNLCEQEREDTSHV